ncbi:hypothetical protein [Chitinophaga silvisoli]|uniref:Uncharacterized protein n=1 Tax=Chitinophaga silvisoli TaxID=2291814 RepID=A0A3E1NSE8_9BACT|nr:hypothetical protein [Chitinophaga silvisoli]RFM30832.1 hypothetical protein DXN04_32495 [Chitinophaga silvisoli]
MSVEEGDGFIGLYTDTSGKTYALSPYGTLYSCTGHQTLKRELLTPDYAQFIVLGGAGDDIYAAGNHSTMFHKKGSGGWVREKFGGDTLWFTALYADTTEVWAAAGTNGSIWHRTKTGTWQQQAIAGDIISTLYRNGNELWALAGKSLYNKTDTGWKLMLSADKKERFYTMYQYDKYVWVMGSGGNIFYNNGGEEWKKENIGDTSADILCSYGIKEEVYAAGKNGLILHRLPGGRWVKEVNGYLDVTANCMYGKGHDIWIGCSDGLIFHNHGNGAWIKEAGPEKGRNIKDLSAWGESVFAAGNYATLLTRTHNNTWNKIVSPFPDTPLTSIFKFNKDILVAGSNGKFYHRLADGQWQIENSHAGDIVFTDLYENSKSVYLVGNNGTITWRHKTDTAWKSQVIGSANFVKIKGYGDDIWIIGNHSVILHKKENEDDWRAIHTGASEVDFLDLYGWNGQLWVLGIKDQRGVVFHKDVAGKWSKEDVHNGVDHFHALYGYKDTIFAVGASGDWAGKDKTGNDYEGTIICKKGNNPWEIQVNHVSNMHFNDINGQGDDIYALGTAGRLYHKKGDGDWEEEDTYQHNETLKKLFFFKGIVMLADNGFVYKENEDKNYIRINRTDKLINMVALDDDLFCIDRNTIFRLTTKEEKYPVIDKVRYTPTPPINPTSIDLNFVLQTNKNAAFKDNYRIEFYARPYCERCHEENWVRAYGSPAKAKINPQEGILLLSTTIEVANSLRVIPGMESANKICLRMDVYTEDGRARESFIVKDENGNPFITLENNFWLKNKVWIILAGTIVLYYAFWLLLWFFYPLVFLRIYHAEILQQLISIHPRFQLIVGIVNVLFPLKKLVATARVQNAWVMLFASTAAKKYERSEITQLRSYYVSLPVRLNDPVTGRLVEKPDEKILDQLFNTERTIIQIIGPGGTGKTSLAVAICRWVIQATRDRVPGWIPRLPILLETDSTDVLKEITGLLRSWQNDYAIHEDFVRLLLKNQHLVIVVDSLSERPATIQEYFKTLHTTTPVNALIITARQPIDLQVKEGLYLYPSPLNSNNLLHFITTYLNIYPSHPLQNSREQLSFAEKIVNIIEGHNSRTPVTPILVKLIIEIALKKEGNDERDFQTILTEMPDSIPDVYYQYLVHVNPKNPAAANYLPKQEMLQIAELLGRMSLGNNFLPQDFLEKDARRVIADVYGSMPGDPIQRFIDNGILTRRESLATSYLRFNIDTLAEYLAASALYDEHNTSPQQLSDFKTRVSNLDDVALEFKLAFIQISEYKMKHG